LTNSHILKNTQQTTFLPSANLPTWANVKGVISNLPRGSHNELSIVLNLTPSGLTHLLNSPKNPRYDQVLSILDYLGERNFKF